MNRTKEDDVYERLYNLIVNYFNENGCSYVMIFGVLETVKAQVIRCLFAEAQPGPKERKEGS